MPGIAPESLLTLEAYARERGAFRSKVIEHKKRRTVHLGEHVTLLFEDELTVRYQVQEMLRIERIFEADGIRDELAAYNPLIPDGGNLKVTMMVEYEDPAERRKRLFELSGIQDQIWIQIAEFGKVKGIADEDLEREEEGKTSAVHFLRFELDEPMRRALKQGAALKIGVEHPQYSAQVAVAPDIRASLAEDLA